MKKQILFLAMFTLALIFAGTSNVFGQLVPGITSTQALPPLTCAANASPLHPMAGLPYIYQMDGTTGPEDADQWTWFATKDPSFMSGAVLNTAGMLTTASGDLIAAGANYGIASGTDNISITWSPEILANTEYQAAASTTVFPSPTFVVGYATGLLCADNIQVYEINPIINFTIDIANIDPSAGTTLAWDAPTNQCVDDVQSAVYNSTSNEIDMDYGTNTLYFEVSAANFNADFTPTFTLLSGLVGDQTAVVSLHSTYANAVAGTLIVPSATTNWTAANVGVGNGWATGEQFTAATAADISTGVSIFVKVVISNLTEESLADNIFSLAVDAQDNNETGIWDMENEDCTNDPLLDAADRVDLANHTINPRPTITDDTADDEVVVPNTIITKTP